MSSAYRRRCFWDGSQLLIWTLQKFYSFLFVYAGTTSREKIYPKALELLHKCDYNLTRAKFSIMFPYFIAYNRLKPETAVQLSER